MEKRIKSMDVVSPVINERGGGESYLCSEREREREILFKCLSVEGMLNLDCCLPLPTERSCVLFVMWGPAFPGSCRGAISMKVHCPDLG